MSRELCPLEVLVDFWVNAARMEKGCIDHVRVGVSQNDKNNGEATGRGFRQSEDF